MQLADRYLVEYKIVATNCEDLSLGESIIGRHSFGPTHQCQVFGPVWDSEKCRVHLLSRCEEPGNVWERHPATYQSFDLVCDRPWCSHLTGETMVQLQECLVVMSAKYAQETL